MSQLTAIGTNPQTVILKHESHKLHHEFVVAATFAVKVGMPVKLNTDGEIQPLGAADEEHLCIGHAIHDAAATEYATVIMKGYMIIYTESIAALNAGPVKYASFGAETIATLPNYVAAATNVLTQGWAIDKATAADQVVRVVLRA